MNHSEIDKRFDERFNVTTENEGDVDWGNYEEWEVFGEDPRVKDIKQFIHQEIEQAVQEAEKRVAIRIFEDMDIRKLTKTRIIFVPDEYDYVKQKYGIKES